MFFNRNIFRTLSTRLDVFGDKNDNLFDKRTGLDLQCVAIVGNVGSFDFSFINVFREFGAVVEWYPKLSRFPSDMCEKYDLVVVSEKDFPNVEALVDSLMVFRGRVSSPVVLLSKSATCDDFSCSRSMICDVTLSFPISRTRLVEGVKTAVALGGRRD